MFSLIMAIAFLVLSFVPKILRCHKATLTIYGRIT